MRVFVVGGGGREHAICWKLRQSAEVTELYCAPGNPGIAAIAQTVALPVDDIAGLLHFAKEKAIDFTVVGPELPLSLGIVDAFRAAGKRIFGPTKFAAQLESSKNFTKEILTAVNAPTARYQSFTDRDSARAYLRQQGAPIVVKDDGLAAGKGVVVAETLEEAEAAVESIFSGSGPKRVVIEEKLEGVEASMFIACGPGQAVPLVSAHDHKRLLNENQGPNTGGMGAVSPTWHISPQQEAEVMRLVVHPVLAEMKRRGTEFSGFLFVGLMLNPRTGRFGVLEFNTRLGDPEAQVLLRRLESDLFTLLSAVESGVDVSAPRWSNDHAVTVVLAAAGYPEAPRKGDVIEGIELAAAQPGVQVFHAGTRLGDDGRLYTNGGRVLNVTGTGATLSEAIQRTYRAVDLIQFAGVQARRDIGKVFACD